MLEAGLWKLALFWRDAKNVIEGDASTGNVLLHFAAGLLIFLVCGSALKGWRRWTLAWIVTLIAALLNEVVDITTERWPNIMQQVAEGGLDLAATMALPTILGIVLTMRSRSNFEKS